VAGFRREKTREARSQHFLRRSALAAELVSAVDVSGVDSILEIGAGKGALTAHLAALSGRGRQRQQHLRVLAVEIDPRLCESLRKRFVGCRNVEVREHNFFDLRLPRHPYAAVGNLPFHCTSAILRRLTEGRHPPRDIVAIVEDRAAARYAGWPWGPETYLSLTLKPWWHVEVGRKLRRHEFVPPPSVDCAVLTLSRRDRALVRAEQAEEFCDFVAAGFGREGNDVAHALRPVFSRTQLRRLSRDLRFASSQTPSSLDFSQWLALFRFFVRQADSTRRSAIRGARGRLPRLPGGG
jgi:23S rRNA (adenine-N6)-dimethyltransferase